MFRFGATHGYAANRKGRTIEFLERLQAGEKVGIHHGVLQNRTYVGHLAEMIAALTFSSYVGVIQLGTTDFSDELDFMRRLGQAFGYPASQVIDLGDGEYNGVATIGKIFEVCGKHLEYTEEDTISALKKSPNLQTYRT